MKWTTSDALTIGGMLSIAGGAALIYPPAGVIVVGVLLGVFGVVLDIAKRRNNKGRRE